MASRMRRSSLFFPPQCSPPCLAAPPHSHFSWGDGGAAALSSEDQKGRRWKVNGSGEKEGEVRDSSPGSRISSR